MYVYVCVCERLSFCASIKELGGSLVLWSVVYVKPHTFYNLLLVIHEKLAEWRSFGSFQGVEKLLDLSGHTTGHRNT